MFWSASPECQKTADLTATEYSLRRRIPNLPCKVPTHYRQRPHGQERRGRESLRCGKLGLEVTEMSLLKNDLITDVVTYYSCFATLSELLYSSVLE